MEPNHKIKKLLSIKGFQKEDLEFLSEYSFTEVEQGAFSRDCNQGYNRIWVRFEEEYILGDDYFVLYEGYSTKLMMARSFPELKELILQKINRYGTLD